MTELEIRVAARGGGARVNLEPRNIERFWEVAEATREAFDSTGGWSDLLARFE